METIYKLIKKYYYISFIILIFTSCGPFRRTILINNSNYDVKITIELCLSDIDSDYPTYSFLPENSDNITAMIHESKKIYKFRKNNIYDRPYSPAIGYKTTYILKPNEYTLLGYGYVPRQPMFKCNSSIKIEYQNGSLTLSNITMLSIFMKKDGVNYYYMIK